MSLRLYHISVLSQGARTVFVERADRLRALRRVVAYLGSRTLWFSLVDTHDLRDRRLQPGLAGVPFGPDLRDGKGNLVLDGSARKRGGDAMPLVLA